MNFAALKKRALALSPLLLIAACTTQNSLDKDMGIQPNSSFAATDTRSAVTAAQGAEEASPAIAMVGAAEPVATTVSDAAKKDKLTDKSDSAKTNTLAAADTETSNGDEKLVQVAALAPTTQKESVAVSAMDPVAPAKVAAVRGSSRDQECLARAMFFESSRSSREGMLAVGSVIMNRVASGRFGNSICGVVGAPRQFAPGVLSRSMNSVGSDLAMDTAAAVLRGERHPKIYPAVMHFHTAGYRFGYDNMHYVAVAGGNSFYEKRKRIRGRANRAQNVIMAEARNAGKYAKPIQAAFVAPAEDEKPIVLESPGKQVVANGRLRRKPAERAPETVPGVPASRPIAVEQPAPAVEANRAVADAALPGEFISAPAAKGGRVKRLKTSQN